MADEWRDNLLHTTALARINERCALAYQHDVRGTLQAVYSTVELLKRALGAGTPDPARIEKVAALATGALQRHEEATLAMLDMLTGRPLSPAALDLGELVVAVGRFLRNEAAAREITLTVHDTSGVTVMAAANGLRTLLVGLLLLAIDSAPRSGEVVMTVTRRGDSATVELLAAGRPVAVGEPARTGGRGLVVTADTTVTYARNYLEERGGGLEVSATAGGSRLLVSYPSLAAPQESLMAR